MPAMLVGFAISILTGNGWLGWLAGGVVVAVIAAVPARARWGRKAACAWVAPGTRPDASEPADAASSPTSARSIGAE